MRNLEDVHTLMQQHGFRVLGRERHMAGPAPWRGIGTLAVPGPARRSLPSYDPRAQWREIHYTMRRDLTCERCSHTFGYIFEVDEISRTHAEGGSNNGALVRKIRHELRRKIKCPACGWVQREPRNTCLRQVWQDTMWGCAAVALPILMAAALATAGAHLFGLAGLTVGLALAVLFSIGVTWWGLFQISSK